MFSFSFWPKCASCFLGAMHFPLIGSKTVWVNLQNTAILKNFLPLPASPSLTCLEVCQSGKICDFTSAATKTQKRPCKSCHLFVYIWSSEWNQPECWWFCWIAAWLHLPAAVYQTWWAADLWKLWHQMRVTVAGRREKGEWVATPISLLWLE